jgi:hypothetical protein
MGSAGKDGWNPVKRWCADGHPWIDQLNGTVSPSWGFGGTMMPVEDPLRCPEPDRDELGRVTCAGCGRRHHIGSCRDFPAQGRLCTTPYPAPACLKPALGGNRWSDLYLPFDGSWCAWWVRTNGPWRLTFHQGIAGGEHWTSVYKCWDVETGDAMLVDRTWQARRAEIGDYPAYLRERWWRAASGRLIGDWRTAGRHEAGWLIDGRQAVAWITEAVELGRSGSEAQLMFDF